MPELVSQLGPAEIQKEIRRLLRYQRREVINVIRAYRKLTGGKRRELGVSASYLVSLMESEIRSERLRALKIRRRLRRRTQKAKKQ